MAKKRISDVLIEVLANAGIERIYGITGDVYKRQVPRPPVASAPALQ